MSRFESPMKDHPLGLAARYNDADTEEKGLKMTVEDQGLEFPMVMYIAEQRALRNVFARTRPGYLQSISRRQPSMPIMTEQEKQMLKFFIPSILDGIMIGWRARDIWYRDNKENNGA